MQTIKLSLKGRIPSKKNSKRIVRAHGRYFVIPSKAYTTYAERAIWLLRQQAGKQHFTTPVSVVYTFLLKGKYRVDTSNLIASVDDLLVDAGILADDDLIVQGSFTKSNGHADWQTTIEIIPLGKDQD